MASDEYSIEWSPSYELQWSDFKLEINPHPKHDSTSAIGFSYTWNADFDDRENPKKYQIIDVNLVAEFHRSASFVDHNSITDEHSSNVLLIHEQGHFDLAEELIPEFTKQVLSSSKGRWFKIEGDSDKEKKDFIRSTAQSFVKEQVERVRQNFFIPKEKLYDEITNHGKIESEQEKFNKRFQLLRESKLKSKK